MSVLSFVALELQTTHLDPASVSQASYVKIVNGNATLVDSWPVIPPTISDDAAHQLPHQAKSWGEALSQLNMMVGTLPVVSYYRDADKEVFQTASQYSGDTPPEFRWLDCRELAKKYLPELPEFQLSTVLKALDLFEEYGDSNSVEQTSQIVMELAHRHNASSVKELWGELYNQPDKLLGLDAGLEGLNFAVGPAALDDQTFENAHDEGVFSEDETVPKESIAAEQTDAEQHWDPEPPVAAETEPEALEEHTAYVEDDPEERVETSHSQKLPDTELHDDATVASPSQGTEPLLAQPVPPTSDDLEDIQDDTAANAEQDNVPAATSPTEPVEELPESQQFATAQPSDEPELAEEHDLASVPEQSTVTPEANTAESHGQADVIETPDETVSELSEEPAVPSETEDQILAEEPAPAERRTAIPTFEVVEVVDRPVREPQGPTKSRTLRTLGFAGVFGFGLLTIVGLVLTVMATMLFFTDSALMLETKIAGVILTGAITLLSLLMTTISFKSFREN